jgi:signal transduction histidine kinase
VFPFVVATYSAAAHARRVWPVAVLALGTSVLRDVYDPSVHSVNDALFSSTLALLTFLAGVEGRRLYVRANRLDDRAARLEQDEEQRAAAAAEAERRRIARELHDIISHGLGVMVLQAGAAEQVIATDPERARGALVAVRTTGQEAIGELSTLLGLMREGASHSREPNPTVADVAQLVARAQAGGMSVRMHLDVGAVRLSPALELSVYRIVQEALTNASKHAIGAQVEVEVTADDSTVRISVVDDGAVAAGAPGGRRGLAGMAERVAVFGGTLSAGPRNGGGWAVEAVLPVRR